MTTAGIPRLRWRIGSLLGAGVLINYFDRISLSVAGPQLQTTLGLSAPQLGLLFSAFFWTYALSQIPAGMILDRWGVTRVGRWSACLWGVASALTAIASGFVGIFAARALLGLAEAPSFGVPVLYHDKLSKGTQSYLALAGELLNNAVQQTVTV